MTIDEEIMKEKQEIGSSQFEVMRQNIDCLNLRIGRSLKRVFKTLIFESSTTENWRKMDAIR